ncbi:MAG: HD domain-containing protein [Chloroflexi bacterium]|nr:HD domain-containing protein [Chloroflexota bacterium]
MSTLTIDEAKAYYSGAESAHDFDHVLRVLAMAERLARAEGADIEIVHTATLLHDISRPDEDTTGGDHALMAAERARAMVLERGMSPAQADAVAHAIAAHRFRTSTPPHTIEAQVLFDADKLDSIGAIGVARAYQVSGALNQRLWSEVSSDAMATRDQRNSDHSAYAEFVVKLSKVRERLYTVTARKIADERHAYMSEFFTRLGREIQGEL